MKWLGLTGGIATGKSTVTEILRKSGFPVIDADVISKEVVQRGTPGFKKIVEVFGKNYVQENGELDRKKLGQLVFDNPERRQDLERIIHPLVQSRVRELRTHLESQGHPIAFYDVPLLFEKNLQDQFDGIVVVACSAQHQLERLMKRDHLSRSEAASRVGSQISVLDKAAQANFVILNDGAPADLQFEVQEFIKKLKDGESTSPKNIQK